MDNRARIEKEKLKLKNIKIRQKVAKQQLKSGKKLFTHNASPFWFVHKNYMTKKKRL